MTHDLDKVFAEAHDPAFRGRAIHEYGTIRQVVGGE